MRGGESPPLRKLGLQIANKWNLSRKKPGYGALSNALSSSSNWNAVNVVLVFFFFCLILDSLVLQLYLLLSCVVFCCTDWASGLLPVKKGAIPDLRLRLLPSATLSQNDVLSTFPRVVKSFLVERGFLMSAAHEIEKIALTRFHSDSKWCLIKDIYF